MAKSRKDLDKLLRDILAANGISRSNLYFQPPNDVHLSYPCIIYSLSKIDTDNADNQLYRAINRYDILVISNDPDNTIALSIMSTIGTCFHSRRYVSDNLYHDALTLYF